MTDRRAPRDQARTMSNSSTAAANQLRLQREAAERRDFTTQLVSAIGEAERRRAAAPWPELAARAYDKLQYDLPLVGADELRALLHAFCVALDGKAGMPPFPLTGKFVVNVVAGARAGAEGASGGTAPAAGPPPSTLIYRHLCAVMSLPLVARLLASPEEAAWEALAPLSRAAATGFDGEHEDEEEEEEVEGGDGGAAAAAFAAAAAASAAAAAAAAAAAQDGSRAEQDDNDGERMAAVMDSDGDAYEDIAPLPGPPRPSSSSLAQGLGALSLNGSGSGSGLRQQQQPRPPPPYDGDWPALRSLLVSLASLVEHLLGADGAGGGGGGAVGAAAQAHVGAASSTSAAASLWVRGAALGGTSNSNGSSAMATNGKHGAAGPRDDATTPTPSLPTPTLDAGAHLLAALRAAGAHPRGTEELAPVAATLLSALVDRAAREPADGVALLEGAWDALLGSAGSGSSAAAAVVPRTSASSQQTAPLPAEATLAMGSAVAAGARLLARAAAGGGSATTAALRRLWSLVDARLLPLVERCADALAHPPARASSQSTASADEGAALASALLVAQALELYVRARPEGVDAGAQLAERGLLRPLALLFARHAKSPAAEPLRRAVLLAAVSSPAARNWLCAVPAVVEAARGLEEEAVAVGEGDEEDDKRSSSNNSSAASALTGAHAVLWRALLLGGPGPATSKAPASSSSSAPLLRVLERGRAALEPPRPQPQQQPNGGAAEEGGVVVVVEGAADDDDDDDDSRRRAAATLLLATVSLLADARHARRAALPLPADVDGALRSLLAGAVRACAAASAAANAAASTGAGGAEGQDLGDEGDEEEGEDDGHEKGERGRQGDDDDDDDDARDLGRDRARVAVEARRAARLQQALVRALKEIVGGGGASKHD